MNKLRHWYYYLTSPIYRNWVKVNEIQEMNNRMFNLIQETNSQRFCPHIRVRAGLDISHFCDCE